MYFKLSKTNKLFVATKQESMKTIVNKRLAVNEEDGQPAKKRKVPFCRKCQKPMKGHRRSGCT